MSRTAVVWLLFLLAIVAASTTSTAQQPAPPLPTTTRGGARRRTGCLFPPFPTFKRHYARRLAAICGANSNNSTKHRSVTTATSAPSPSRQPLRITCESTPHDTDLMMKSLYLGELGRQVSLGYRDFELPHCEGCKNTEYPMVGETRSKRSALRNIHHVLSAVARRMVPGAWVEAGTWRGGSSIFARAVLNLLELPMERVYLVDSFAGMPLPSRSSPGKGKEEEEYDAKDFLSSSVDDVRQSFADYCLSNNVFLVKGGDFNSSALQLAKTLDKENQLISVLRLDADTYESTMDVLYRLYQFVSANGYVIVDNFGWTSNVSGAKKAVVDFRQMHEIEDVDHRMMDVDGSRMS